MRQPCCGAALVAVTAAQPPFDIHPSTLLARVSSSALLCACSNAQRAARVRAPAEPQQPGCQDLWCAAATRGGAGCAAGQAGLPAGLPGQC